MHKPVKHRLDLTIDGHHHSVELSPEITLLDLLRERMHLTGTKKGRDHGQCGACTVLVDGRRINYPLGSLMRMRQRACDNSQAFRSERNGCPVHDPSSGTLS